MILIQSYIKTPMTIAITTYEVGDNSNLHNNIVAIRVTQL